MIPCVVIETLDIWKQNYIILKFVNLYLRRDLFGCFIDLAAATVTAENEV